MEDGQEHQWSRANNGDCNDREAAICRQIGSIDGKLPGIEHLLGKKCAVEISRLERGFEDWYMPYN